MPGPALHHMIADRLRMRIDAGAGLGPTIPAADMKALRKLLADKKNLPYLFLGCQGPDFLFFNTKDFSGALKTLVTTYLDIGDFIETFKRDVKALVPQPVLDALEALDEAANEVVQSSSTLSELEQLFGDMKSVVEALAATLEEGVKRFIADFDLFDMISHPYRDGIPEGAKAPGFDVNAARAAGDNEWWWFDALHYRHTGKFARHLLANTTAQSPLHLYAIGYLTHVTADTVGHPYVNAISGGPYRSHAQRHKASENYQDVFNLLTERGEDWNRSALHALYNFNFTGPIDTANDLPDPFTNMPADLASLLAEALNAVYQEDADPSRPEYAKTVTPDDINDTYRLWYRWMKSATDTGTLPAPVPYSFSAELREVWDKAMDNLGDIGDFIGDAADTAGSMGIWGIFLLLAALIAAAVAAAAAVIDAVLGALTTLGSATIRYAASLVYEQLYTAFQTFRLAVAMNGLAFPMQEHLGNPIIRHFANPALTDSGNVINALAVQHKLPMLRFTDGGNPNIERHLVYPPTEGEAPAVFAVPHHYLSRPATWYAWGDIPFDPTILKDMLALTREADPQGRDDATRIGALLHEKGSLGNALSLTEAMYDLFAQGSDLPDFNLDGDRGYGYLCWAQRGDPAGDFPNPANSSAQAPGIDISFIR